MFKVGDYIVHGRNGVCKVMDITHIDISGADKNQLYYTLIPMKSEDSKIFYPVDSDRIVMRSVLTKEEAENIMSEIKDIEPMWIDNEKKREAQYKEAISSCDCEKLICIIKTLYERNTERIAQGKRITYVDDRYLKEAKRNLHDEFSIALGIDREEVEKYIREHIEN
ncbi:CarD family transcriptional regulator [uncultured Eubacterium sp.]|uniref:CarD family transcriptional regulator n=1 Tax=uncultured Eubacterium sp. TaxID=165185 RepID=UPI00267299CA|nr:CarD family transcriptional regulator [uncultured Eubacterium sp.]